MIDDIYPKVAYKKFDFENPLYIKGNKFVTNENGDIINFKELDIKINNLTYHSYMIPELNNMIDEYRYTVTENDIEKIIFNDNNIPLIKKYSNIDTLDIFGDIVEFYYYDFSIILCYKNYSKDEYDCNVYLKIPHLALFKELYGDCRERILEYYIKYNEKIKDILNTDFVKIVKNIKSKKELKQYTYKDIDGNFILSFNDIKIYFKNEYWTSKFLINYDYIINIIVENIDINLIKTELTKYFISSIDI